MSNRQTNQAPKAKTQNLNRRKFLRSTASVGAGMVFTPTVFAKSEQASKIGDINVALIGLGEQGFRLLEAIVFTKIGKTGGVKFKAVCDIWPYRLVRNSNLLKAFKHDVTPYENYEEMLEKEKSLDAVIIATPDWLHAPMAIACLEAGLHVYCEKEMSNNLEDAKKMVRTAKKKGKLLQIGHQRRSNPRYQAASKLIREYNLLGKLLNINAQWNRSVSSHKYPVPTKKIWVAPNVLKQYGYDSMEQLVNWRWYKKFGGGPLSDLGSHQIDLFNWFLGEAKPKSVLASGGKDFYKYEHNENVMTIYDYALATGSVRAFYQVLNTTCWGTYGQYYETFMGEFGTLLISEFGGDKNNGWLFIEEYAESKSDVKKRWNQSIREKLIGGKYLLSATVKDKSILVLPGSEEVVPHPLLTKGPSKVHQPHLQNFFDAIRGKAKLNCPGETGYETAVSVLKANEAIEKQGRVEFKPEDFRA
jgi:predicted dehydrogenase